MLEWGGVGAENKRLADEAIAGKIPEGWTRVTEGVTEEGDLHWSWSDGGKWVDNDYHGNRLVCGIGVGFEVRKLHAVIRKVK